MFWNWRNSFSLWNCVIATCELSVRLQYPARIDGCADLDATPYALVDVAGHSLDQELLILDLLGIDLDEAMPSAGRIWS